MLGHSVGELAAIHIAGVLDLSDACRLVVARGRLMQALAFTRHGSTVSLEATAAEVTAAISAMGLNGKVDIAGHNTPTQTVVSGDVDAVEGVASHFARQLGRKVKSLDVSHAFHSYHMDDILPAFQAVAETLRFNPHRLDVVSGLTGKLAEAGQLEQSSYWVQQARRAVRFSDGIRTLYHQQRVNMFLELGHQPVLLGMAAACLAADQQHNKDNELPAFLPSLISGKQDDTSVVNRTLAKLHVMHVPIDWPTYFKPFSCQRVELPTYAFQRARFNWLDSSRVTNADLNKYTAATDHQNKELRLASSRGGRSSDSSNHFSQFKIDWHQVDRSKIKLGNGSSWGLMCPAGDVAWILEAKVALSRADIWLNEVRQLQDAKHLDGLLCLWDVSSNTDILRQAYHITAKALSQLQTAAMTSFAPPLVWITRQAIGINAHDICVNSTFENDSKYDQNNNKKNGLGAGPLWGLMRTARNEHPGLRLRLIDLGEEKAAFETLAPALMLGADSDEPECAVRHEQVLVPQLQRANVPKPVIEQRRPLLRQDGAVLITGGLGGSASR